MSAGQRLHDVDPAQRQAQGQVQRAVVTGLGAVRKTAWHIKHVAGQEIDLQNVRIKTVALYGAYAAVERQRLAWAGTPSNAWSRLAAGPGRNDCRNGYQSPGSRLA